MAHQLNSYQVDCINSDGNLLIIAGAGSGKTTVLSHRAARLLNEKPESTLVAVTFTREAAKDLKSRILTYSPLAKNRIGAGTFHSLAITQLKRAGIRRKILTEIDSIKIIRKILQRYSSNFSAESLLTSFSEMQSLRNPNYYPLYERNADFRAIWDEYSYFKTKIGVMDFGDMLQLAVDGMRNGTVQPFAATYLLGDESQDMDEIQHEWVLLHAQNGTEVTLVGDDDQSIYGFRNASGYDGMVGFMQNTLAKKKVLPVNYRCGSSILDLASVLIEKNKKRIDKPIKSGVNFPGTILKPRYFPFCDEKGSYPRIYELIGVIKIITDYANSCGGGFQEWAILSRDNLNFLFLERILREENILFYREKDDIWDHYAAKILLGILQYLAKGDWFGMTTFLDKFISSGFLFENIGSMDLRELYRLEHEENEDAKIRKYNCEVLKNLIYLEDQWRSLLDKGMVDKVVSEVCAFVRPNLDAFFFNDDSKCKAEEIISGCETRLVAMKEQNLSQRLFKAINPNLNNRDSLREKILAKAQYENRLFLNLYTMHGSKGLEFDHVFVIGCDDESLLKQDEITGKVDIEEARRLFYVAITRAKKTIGFSMSCELSAGMSQPSSTFIVDDMKLECVKGE